MSPEHDPRYAQAISYHQNGNVNAALPLYVALYARFPWHAHLLASYGTCLVQCGDPARGIPLLEQALTYAPTLEFAQTNYAGALAMMGLHEEALLVYQKLPDSSERWQQRGDLLLRLERLDEALAAYDAGLALEETAKLHYGRGLTLTRLERKEEALRCFDAATYADPNHADAWHEQGRLLRENKRHTDALMCFNAALICNPQHVASYVNLCATLVDLSRFEEALAAATEALTIYPCKDTYLSHGVALYHQKDYERSLASIDQALALAPEDTTTWAHRGFLLRTLNRLEEARTAYEQALKFSPKDNDTNWAYANLLLATGDFFNGWRHYEWRWNREEGKVYKDSWPAAPRWLGDWSIQGKKLLVLCEQGMGDSLQFCRYLPMLTALGADVTLMIQRPLMKLMADSFPGIKVLPSSGSTAGFDFFTQLLSLPMALRTTLHTIPCQPYLRADPALVRRWFKRLGAKLRPRIGLAWSGNPHPKSDHKRTIPLADLAPILSQDADFYVLQRDIREEDDLSAFPNLHHLPEALDGFDQTAALAMCMDRIITIDTSIAHLVGGLGLKTWMLVPYYACWRWLLDRDDSPWYPRMTLFRQPEPGAWAPVIARAAERLDYSLHSHS